MKCFECKFVSVSASGVNNDSGQKKKYWIECHRHAPEFVLKNTEEDCCGWPTVGLDDFCGDWEGHECNISVSFNDSVDRLFFREKTIRDAMQKLNIKTISELSKRVNELLSVKGFGECAYYRVTQKLKGYYEVQATIQ